MVNFRNRPTKATPAKELPTPILRLPIRSLDLNRWWKSHSQNPGTKMPRSEEHTSELQSQSNLVCRLLLEKKKKKYWSASYESSTCNCRNGCVSLYDVHYNTS